MTPRGRGRAARHLTVAALLAAGCGGGGEGEAPAGPPTAQPGIVEMLRQDAAAQRHPADGGGRAWLAAGEPVPAGERGRWTIVYEAGPLGVGAGGTVYLQVSPFWGWSTPQTELPGLPGYTVVATDAEGVELRATAAGQQLLAVEIGGRGLVEGERLRIEYGAEPGGAVADRFAEGRSPFYVAVDGDGDGVRALVAEDPATPVLARGPARLVAILPSTARPGQRVRLTLAVLDRGGSAGVEVEGEIHLQTELAGPASVALPPQARGVIHVELAAQGPGTYVVRAEGPAGLAAESNPLVVTEGPRLLWGDLHGHSVLSDGTGTPEEYYRYARDVAALDVVSLTDHDHWGMRPLSAAEPARREIVEATRRFHDRGRLVTLLGFEWTNWIHGHRHVLYFDSDSPPAPHDFVIDSLDPATDSPDELWAALEGREALTFAHHSAGGPVATDWSFAPDPRFEPVTEVSSVHGSSEAADSPGRIYAPVAGNTVRDQLDRGYRLGVVGSGDSHDGHPGLAHLV
ncbi:MAG: hypothetical protein R3325_16990, partial [Thermoanaerobaculia bacterium]|nr:hypothetical protein [Thermoanaerobaculia bacterium]